MEFAFTAQGQPLKAWNGQGASTWTGYCGGTGTDGACDRRIGGQPQMPGRSRIEDGPGSGNVAHVAGCRTARMQPQLDRMHQPNAQLTTRA